MTNEQAIDQLMDALDPTHPLYSWASDWLHDVGLTVAYDHEMDGAELICAFSLQCANIMPQDFWESVLRDCA